jgi:hypothetical protein
VLIGDRQLGRPLAESVSTPGPDRASIERAVRGALDDDGARGGTSVFGSPGFAQRVARTLGDHEIPRPPRKSFHDLERDASR